MKIKNWYRRYPLLSRFSIFIILPALIAVYMAYQHWVLSPLPLSVQTQQFTQLEKPIKVTRDKYGVPYIEASSQHDIFFATGYIHAQDRLWQLELQRRLSTGTLSEIFGKESLQYDTWVRTLGLHHVAKRNKETLSTDALNSLQAYADGINSFISTTDNLPIEFTSLGLKPKPWQVTDSLAWMKMFALSMSGNLDEEIQHSVAQISLPKNLLALFFSPVQTDFDTLARNNIQPLSGVHQTIKKMEADYNIGGKHVGSNAWVVSSKLSASGNALLANDPHLGLQIPSLWYAVSQQTPGSKLEGMTLIGLPLIVFGKNQYIAWGGTNMEADLQDLVIEQIHPTDGNRYKYQEDWLPFRYRTEKIKVKADFPTFLKPDYEDVTLTVKETVTGPVISDTHLKNTVSLRWTALNNDDSSYEGFFRLNQATDWQSFQQAGRLITSPSLNLFYIDEKQNIGHMGVGHIPLRQTGKGEIPSYRSANGDIWDSIIPWPDMPKEFNPDRGYIVNANNRNVQADYPYHISSSFADPARAERIIQLLNKPSVDLAHIKRMQLDIKDLTVTQLKKLMLTVKAEDLWQQEALDYLAKWNEEAQADSVAATLFYTWARQVYRVLLNDELLPAWGQLKSTGILLGLRDRLSYDDLANLISQKSAFCNDINTDETESCEQVLVDALDRALILNSKLHGDEISDWQWGKFQTTRYEHMPFGKMKHIKSIFSREIATGGSSNTINVAAGKYERDNGFIQDFGAGFRQIIEARGDYYFINSTGQSGQLASPHYDDMVAGFKQGDYLKFAQPVKSESQLQLMPKK